MSRLATNVVSNAMQGAMQLLAAEGALCWLTASDEGIDTQSLERACARQARYAEMEAQFLESHPEPSAADGFAAELARTKNRWHRHQILGDDTDLHVGYVTMTPVFDGVVSGRRQRAPIWVVRFRDCDWQACPHMGSLVLYALRQVGLRPHWSGIGSDPIYAN